MNATEASAAATIINQQYPGRIHATVDDRLVNGNGNGYRLRLVLIVGQRTATVNGKTQIDGILDAWQWFLAERGC